MFKLFATGLGLVSASAMAGVALFASHEAFASGPRLAQPALLSGMVSALGEPGNLLAETAPAPAPVLARAEPLPAQCRGTRPMRVVTLQIEARPDAPRVVAAAGRFAPAATPRPMSRDAGRDPQATVLLAQATEPSVPRPRQPAPGILSPAPDRGGLAAASEDRSPKPRPPWDLWDPVALGVYF